MTFQDLCSEPRTTENLRLARLFLTGPNRETAIAAWWSSAPIYEYTNSVVPLPVDLAGTVVVTTGTVAAAQAAFLERWTQRLRRMFDGGELRLADLEADLAVDGVVTYSNLAMSTASPQARRLIDGGLYFPNRRPPKVGTSSLVWAES
jgi:hypothetical protein